jgi:4'-phosphopantetheinyl transferase
MHINDFQSWPVSSRSISLLDNDIHVWGASPDVPKEMRANLIESLSTDELERAGRYHFETDKIHFMTFRGILREILGYYLELKPNEIQFQYGPFGKPTLCASQGPLNFSVSHTNDLALFSFSRINLGIDHENISSDIISSDVSNQFFSTDDNQFLDTLSAESRAKGFFSLWTYKEAVSKIEGMGLSRSLNSPIIFPCSCFQFFPNPGCIAALAAIGVFTNISFWRYAYC